MAIRGVDKHITRLEAWIDSHGVDAVIGSLDYNGMAKVLDVGYHTIANWVKDGHIPASEYKIDPRQVLAHLKMSVLPGYHPMDGSSQKCVTSPSFAVHVTRTPIIRTPDYTSEIGRIRSLMTQAAKEAARDVALLEADRAKGQGNHELRAQLLDDFIHLEEGLKVTFLERQ